MAYHGYFWNSRTTRSWEFLRDWRPTQKSNSTFGPLGCWFPITACFLFCQAKTTDKGDLSSTTWGLTNKSMDQSSQMVELPSSGKHCNVPKIWWCYLLYKWLNVRWEGRSLNLVSHVFHHWTPLIFRGDWISDRPGVTHFEPSDLGHGLMNSWFLLLYHGGGYLDYLDWKIPGSNCITTFCKWSNHLQYDDFQYHI